MLVVIALIAAVMIVAGLVLRQGTVRGLADSAAQAREQLQLHEEALRALIERYRVLPSVLALDPEVRSALSDPAPPSALTDALNRKLVRINGAADTSTLTLLDREGRAVAASNWRSSGSNVGVDYQFRPYFQQAMRTGTGSFYALGVTTSQPGYFLSQAVRDANNTLVGVVVVKLDLSALERAWTALPDVVFLSDRYGVIFLAGRDEWRYRDLRPLRPEEQAAITASRQYGDLRLTGLPYTRVGMPDDPVPRVRHDLAGELLWVSQALPEAGWTLHLMRSTVPIKANARVVALAVAAALTVLILGGYLLRQRRRMAQLRARSQVELQRLVAQHAEEMRSAQDGLVQAARRADYGESPSLQHLPQGVSVIDAELRLVAWNRRYIELFRFPPDLIRVGRPIEDVLRYNAARGLLGAGEVERTIARRLEHLRAGRPHLHEREDSNGTVLEIRGNPLPDGGFVTSYADITAYRQTARELRSLADSLERRIDERTHDLAIAKREAERANRYKTRFVAAAVHDLLQPLNAARMFVSSLRGRTDDPALQTLADSVEGALRSQDEILASLLDISRLESGTLEVKRRDVPLAPLLADLAREMSVLCEAKGLRFRYCPTTAVADTDETLLRRILQNFLSNALRYTARGGVLLGVRRVGAALRIEVWDQGPGIPEEQHAEVFEEFRRLDTGGDLRARGAGLGLAIVDRIARLLGHRVGLRSWPGHGSVFSVTVPRGTAATVPVPAAAAMAPPSASGPLRGLRIWCVEDDPASGEALATLLQGWGCEPQVFASAASVQAALGEAAVPALILLDVRLGDARGPALLPMLRAAWGALPPVVLLTAERDPALRQQAREQGWGYLVKPVSPAALRALITQQLLRGRAMEGVA